MDIKRKIKQMCYEFNRIQAAKKITDNLGRIVIKNGTIFCYVNKRKIESKRRVNFCFPRYYDDIELIRKYDLDLKVCFIVEYAEFSKGLHFTTEKNVKVIFRKCSFGKHITIDNSFGEIIFESNMYYQNPKDIKRPFFNAHASSLRFIDEYLINSDNGALEESSFSLDIKANDLSFGNTLLYVGDNNGTINIETDELTLSDTTIDCPRISINSNNFTTNSSTIYADEYAIVENKNLNPISMIETPELVYNGQEFTGKDGKNFVVRENTSTLVQTRIKLLETLRNAARTCELIKSQNSEQTAVNIDQETVGKVFKIQEQSQKTSF